MYLSLRSAYHDQSQTHVYTSQEHNVPAPILDRFIKESIDKFFFIYQCPRKDSICGNYVLFSVYEIQDLILSVGNNQQEERNPEFMAPLLDISTIYESLLQVCSALW